MKMLQVYKRRILVQAMTFRQITEPFSGFHVSKEKVLNIW